MLAAGTTSLSIRKHNGDGRERRQPQLTLLIPSFRFPPSMMPESEMGNGGGVIVTATGGIARLNFLAKRHDYSNLADSVADRDKCSNGGQSSFRIAAGRYSFCTQYGGHTFWWLDGFVQPPS